MSTQKGISSAPKNALETFICFLPILSVLLGILGTSLFLAGVYSDPGVTKVMAGALGGAMLVTAPIGGCIATMRLIRCNIENGI